MGSLDILSAWCLWTVVSEVNIFAMHVDFAMPAVLITHEHSYM